MIGAARAQKPATTCMEETIAPSGVWRVDCTWRTSDTLRQHNPPGFCPTGELAGVVGYEGMRLHAGIDGLSKQRGWLLIR